jgi:ribose 5-phosphate isomerase B
MSMRIALGSDHAGFLLKEHLKVFLAKFAGEVQFQDVGTFTKEPVDYPDYAEAVAKCVLSSNADRGILICGSGVGASVAANKFWGIRAGLCHDLYSARQGVEHDDMNVLTLGARVIGDQIAENLVEAFLTAQFTKEARHLRRLAKVREIEIRQTVASGRLADRISTEERSGEITGRTDGSNGN